MHNPCIRHCRFKKDLLTVNLDALSQRIQQGRLDSSSVITMQTLREAGLIGKKVSSGVKLLGRVSKLQQLRIAKMLLHIVVLVTKLSCAKTVNCTVQCCQSCHMTFLSSNMTSGNLVVHCFGVAVKLYLLWFRCLLAHHNQPTALGQQARVYCTAFAATALATAPWTLLLPWRTPWLQVGRAHPTVTSKHDRFISMQGASKFQTPLHLPVSETSKSAQQAVEKAGGSVTTVYYNQLGLRALLTPEFFADKGRQLPRPARPPTKVAGRYDQVGQLPPNVSLSAQTR